MIISGNFFAEAKRLGCGALVFVEIYGSDPLSMICLHQASIKSNSSTPENFLKYLQDTKSDTTYKFIEAETRLQGRQFGLKCGTNG